MPKKNPVFLNINEAMSLVEKETQSTTNRGIVLVCGAILDRYLEKLLRLKFTQLAPDCSEGEKDLWLVKEPLPPLGSAAMRARMARMLGLIDKPTSDALGTLFSIRNDFAHLEAPPELNDSLVGKIQDALPEALRVERTANLYTIAYEQLREPSAYNSPLPTERAPLPSGRARIT